MENKQKNPMDNLMNVMSKIPFTVNRKINREIFQKAIRNSGIKLPPHQLHLLKMLSNDGYLGISTLEEELALARPQISHCINSLIKEGLITRSTDQNDKRKGGISITKEGKKKIEQIDQEVGKEMRSFFSSLSERELEKLANSFEYISQKISEV